MSKREEKCATGVGKKRPVWSGGGGRGVGDHFQIGEAGDLAFKPTHSRYLEPLLVKLNSAGYSPPNIRV
jgi:hypothetical protein